MLKKLFVVSMFVVCCYCEEEMNNVILLDETRAKKQKSLRFLAMIVLFALLKIAIIKAATFFFFLAFFQKLFSVGGVLLTYFMQNQLGMAMSASPSMVGSSPSVAAPSPSYGSPTDYNTLGYSYGPPDDAAFHAEGSSLPEFGGPYNWILNKS